MGLVYGVPNASHDVREGARRDYLEALLHSSRYANSTLPRGASKVRTVCGSSRKHGSVRAVAGNGHPYRDGRTGGVMSEAPRLKLRQAVRSLLAGNMRRKAHIPQSPSCSPDAGVGMASVRFIG